MNNQNNVWLFGQNAGIDFNSPPAPPPIEISGALITSEGCAAISDATTGQLLFYTDGQTVYNVYDNTSGTAIPNGTGLQGDSTSTSSAIIVPMPGSTTHYYIFAISARTEDTSQPQIGLSYSIVDATISTAPVVTATKNMLLEANARERVIAIKKANCEDYWIIATNNTGDTFYVFSLTSDSTNPITSLTPQTLGNSSSSSIGYLKASPTADKLAMATLQSGLVEVFDFDLLTGIISNPQNLNINFTRPYGIEFSNDGNLLYVSRLSGSGTDDGVIYQKEINNSNPFVEIESLTNGGSGYAFGALQMGPNGIIYVAKPDSNSLAAIRQPDNIDSGPGGGNECDFEIDEIDLDNNTCRVGLPTLVQFAHCETENCSDIIDKVNEILSDKCENMVNPIEHCNEDDDCHCDTNSDCVSVDIPEIRPCISIKYGDSDCDCLEGDDFEIMCITVCNCYSNVTFKGFTIGCIEVCNEDGTPVDTLPDDTPSIQLVPIGPYCFGDIEPCSCVSREFTLIMRGARTGKYKIKVRGICYDVCFHYDDEECFEFDIC